MTVCLKINIYLRHHNSQREANSHHYNLLVNKPQIIAQREAHRHYYLSVTNNPPKKALSL